MRNQLIQKQGLSHLGKPKIVRGSGFSLMEVLIAMAILTFGATSLIALFASGSTTHKRAVDRTRAALVAEELFSEIQVRYNIEAEPKDIIKSLQTNLPKQIQGYYWEVILFRPARTREAIREGSFAGKGEWGVHEMVVRIAIKWGYGSQSREEVYSTILLPR